MKRTTLASLALIAAVALLILTGCPDANPVPEAPGTGDPLETLDGWWLATGVAAGEMTLDIVVEATATEYTFLIFEEGELIEGSVHGTYQISQSAIVTTDTEEFDAFEVNWVAVEGATAESRAYTYNATAQTVRFSVEGVAVTFVKTPAPAIDESIVGWWEAPDFGYLDLFAESYYFSHGDFYQSGTWTALAGYILATIDAQSGAMYAQRMIAPQIETNSFHRYTFAPGAESWQDILTIHFPDGDVVFNREEPS